MPPFPNKVPVEMTRTLQKKVDLYGFTSRMISNSKINPQEMKWVVDRVAKILEKGQELTKKEVDSAIHSIRILLSKMQLLKARGFTKLAREILNPGEGHTTRSNILVLPRRTKRPERKALPSSFKKVA